MSSEYDFERASRRGHGAPRALPAGGLVPAFPGIAAALTWLAGCADPAWSAAGSMVEARAHHTATTLDDGDILFAGGEDAGHALAGAERYDPRTGTWSRAAPMSEARVGHTATAVLREERGRVLVVGGENEGGVLAGAELYDPELDTWQEVAPMNEARRAFTATRLPGGQVLVAGGENEGGVLASAELYDPEQGTWQEVAPMKEALPEPLPDPPPPEPPEEPRKAFTATRLPGGQVLVAGGEDDGGALKSALLYDPAAPPARAWRRAGSPAMARSGHTATLLPRDGVLLVGGHDGAGAPAGAELYDPAADGWKSVDGFMNTNRAFFTATLLRDGEVLIVGAGPGEPEATAERYDPRTGTWTEAGALTAVRDGHTATLLAGGEVLIAGGDGDGALGSAEIYRPGAQCETLDDCPASLVCSARKECEPPRAEALTGACAAAGGGAPAGGGVWLVGVLLSLAGAGRRRRPSRDSAPGGGS